MLCYTTNYTVLQVCTGRAVHIPATAASLTVPDSLHKSKINAEEGDEMTSPINNTNTVNTHHLLLFLPRFGVSQLAGARLRRALHCRTDWQAKLYSPLLHEAGSLPPCTNMSLGGRRRRSGSWMGRWGLDRQPTYPTMEPAAKGALELAGDGG